MLPAAKRRPTGDGDVGPIDLVVARGTTHFVTDVFADDPHSPYGFHTRLTGFHPVATHDLGELRCESRRITMVLDLKAAYRRLKQSGNWMCRYLTCEWDEGLHRRLAAASSASLAKNSH